MRDDLGDRMKSQYENRTRYYLPRRTYTLVRVDGRSFHNFTKAMERPFDFGLMEDMDRAALALCTGVTGCVLGYVQSDEISLVLTDFATQGTEAWFDGNIQKIASVSAGIATCAFNQARMERTLRAWKTTGSALDSEAMTRAASAHFDARVFTISDPTEVENYLIWRQQDATRNSISMAAHAVYTHEELVNKSTDALQEMLWQKGINWNDYPERCKRGRTVVKNTKLLPATFTHQQTGEVMTVEAERTVWEVEVPPVFTRERTYLATRLPRYV